MPVLVRKFEASVRAHFDSPQARAIIARCADRIGLEAMRVDEFVDTLVR
jgi:hypothetical protein